MNKKLLKKKSLETPSLNVFTTLAAMLLLVCAGFAQTTVSGKITASDDSSPLPGVNVVLKGTNNGTITDANGNYTLTTSSSEGILVFSFVGYLTQEIAVGNNSRIDIVLASDAKHLSEVVVTALGIEKDVSKLGYSQQKVLGSDLVKAREPN